MLLWQSNTGDGEIGLALINVIATMKLLFSPVESGLRGGGGLHDAVLTEYVNRQQN